MRRAALLITALWLTACAGDPTASTSPEAPSPTPTRPDGTATATASPVATAPPAPTASHPADTPTLDSGPTPTGVPVTPTGAPDTPTERAPRTPRPTPTPGPTAPHPTFTPPTPTAPPTPTPAPITDSPTPPPTPTATPTAPPPTPTPTEPPPDAPVVQTDAGPVGGLIEDADLVEGQTYSYRTIPFAAPPVGPRRWAPPQEPAPWTEPLPGRAFPERCVQYSTSIVAEDPDGPDPEDVEIVGSEDCLYLNVWRPVEEIDALRPVLVWIHGGGNEIGYTANPVFDSANLARVADAVVVTIQYRLGPLGYLKHPALATGDPLADGGSFGSLDIHAALAWVQRNAGAFGGDPTRVTAFGESAGAVNTWMLRLSSQASELFHATIAESGAPSFTLLDGAAANAADLTARLLIADGLAEDAEGAAIYAAAQGAQWEEDYLRGKTGEEILSVYKAENGGLLDASFEPIADGYLFPTDPLGDALSGDFNHAPLITGANRDEIKLFIPYLATMTNVEYNVLMRSVYGDAVEDIEALYPRQDYNPATPYNQFADIHDFVLELFTLYTADVSALYMDDLWVYHFRYDDAIPPYDYVYGAAHGLELPFVFGHFSEVYPRMSYDAWRELSLTMMGAWGCFARTFDPGACEEPAPWPAYTVEGEGARQLMVYDVPTSIEPLPDIFLTRMAFWLDYVGGVGGAERARLASALKRWGVQLPPPGAAR